MDFAQGGEPRRATTDEKTEKLAVIRAAREKKQRKKDEALKKLEVYKRENGDDPEAVQYQQIVNGVNEKVEQLDNDIMSLQEQEEDIIMGDAEDTNGDDVIKAEASSSSVPTVTFDQGSTAGKSASDPIVIDDDKLDLIKVQETRPTAGMPDADNYRKFCVVKTSIGRGKVAIVQYGPPNAAVYRIEDVTHVDIPPGVPDISNEMERPGQMSMFVNGSKRWKLNRQNCVSIQGVAFPNSCTVSALDPDRKRSSRFIPTNLLIRWQIDGETQKSWEIRTVFNRVWNKAGHGPDFTIYNAALEAERRFREWKQGTRKAVERSPTPNPQFAQIKSRAKSEERTSRKGKRAVRDAVVVIDSDSDVNDTEEEFNGFSEDEDDSSQSNEDTTDDVRSDLDVRTKKKTKGKKRSQPIDPIKFEKAWCLVHGKDIYRLSESSKRKMKKALRERR